MRRKFPILICLLLLLFVSSGFQQKWKLTEAEVIEKAEAFVAQQGYTDVPPIKDKSKWSPDSVWGKPDDLIMKSRRNSLEPRAYGVARGNRAKDPYAWIVVFRMNPNHERYREIVPNYKERVKKVGCAVTMNPYGGRIRMEHQNIYLEFGELKKLAL
jgi:hypothetical protein